MDAVDEMILEILRREGGYVDHPHDRGGPTNFGITQRTLSRYLGRIVGKQDVRDLSLGLAKEIYRNDYFLSPRIDWLPESIQPFVFDSAVNHGPRQAIKFLQSVCNQAGFKPALSEDGIIGLKTRRVVDKAYSVMGDVLLQALVEERRNFYRTIVRARPSQKVFFKGWMRRVNEFEPEVA